MTQENKQAQALNEVQWIEDQVEERRKQVWVVWLLWFLFGWAGAHRFYMDKTGSAIGIIILHVVAFLTLFILIGILLYFALFIWLIVDAFLITGWLQEDKEKTRQAVERDLQLRKNLHS